MAIYTVDTNADIVAAGDGVLSLREALALADATEAADTILFAGAVQGQTVVLAGSQLTVNSDVTIDGGSGVIIDADGQSRVLLVRAGTEVGIGEFDFNEIALAHVAVTGGRSMGRDEEYGGGGICAQSETRLTLVDSTVSDNVTTDRDYGGGGISGYYVTLINSTVENNRATGRYAGGGGIDAISVTLMSSTVSDNTARGGGGGISGWSTLTSSTVSGNSGRGDGGGILGDCTATDSTISGNIAQGFGGGISGQATLINSTVEGNRAEGAYGNGGGVFGFFVTLTSTTVTGNNAAGDVGGVFVTSTPSRPPVRSLEVANSIVAGNSAVGENDDLSAITSSNGHNIFGSDVAGNVPGDLENVPASLLFAAIDPTTGGGLLVDNGGPTQTIALRDADDNLALGRADPADAAATDQRGEVRPAPEGTNPDIGAFELDQSAPSPPDPSPPIPSPAPPVNEIGGTTGADVLRGTAGADLIRGRPGGDTLWGFAGDDELFGGYGSDVLVGGTGIDRMTGGAGADRFVLRQPEAAPADGPAYDEVLDFSRLQHDWIDLQPIDARSGAAGNQAFSFIGGQEFTAAGQLRFEATADGDFLVSGNTDRDLAADFAFIVRTGSRQLFEGDFLL